MNHFAQRRERFMESFETGVAILEAGSIRYRNIHHGYPYRPAGDFYYLTGYTEADSIALFTPESEQKFRLFVPVRDELEQTWNGRRPSLDEVAERTGADEVHTLDEFDEVLRKSLSRSGRLLHHLGTHAERDRKVLELIRTGRPLARGGFRVPTRVIDPHLYLERMRARKDDMELTAMRRAAAITAEGHQAIRRAIEPGVPEREIEALLTYHFIRNGASGHAYLPIVASGDNATVLHYTDNCGFLGAGQMLLVDSGAEFDYYACDVTRTWPVGEVSAAYRAIHALVLETQEALLDEVRPGKSLEDQRELSVQRITKGLCELGVLTGDVDELIESRAYRPFYMHNPGHWIGLDTHDPVPVRADGGGPVVFEPGMTLTVEPGVYIPASNEEVAPEFRGIGVRIEDTVVVTVDGHENLTEMIPKGLE